MVSPGLADLAAPHPSEAGVSFEQFLENVPFSGQNSCHTIGWSVKPGGQGNFSGSFLSELEVRQVLHKAGFPAKAIPSMLRIAHCESSYSAMAENVNQDGSVDFGLFQINERNWGGCNVTKPDLSDPYNNARCAYQIWQRQGYRAWNCYARTQMSSLEKKHF
jgi:hypothetical protein